jgi:hypothetical protein
MQNAFRVVVIIIIITILNLCAGTIAHPNAVCPRRRFHLRTLLLVFSVFFFFSSSLSEHTFYPQLITAENNGLTR